MTTPLADDPAQPAAPTGGGDPTRGEALTAHEQALLTDARLHEARHRLEAQLIDFLGRLRDGLAAQLAPAFPHLPPATDTGRGKISRGSNYRNLPYQVLDYPRLLQPQRWLNARSLVLWGHGLSLHLLLKGEGLDAYLQALERHAAALAEAGWHVDRREDPWLWHAEPAQFAAPTQTDLRQQLRATGHLKLSKYHGLAEPAAWEASAQHDWRQLFSALTDEPLSEPLSQ